MNWEWHAAVVFVAIIAGFWIPMVVAVTTGMAVEAYNNASLKHAEKVGNLISRHPELLELFKNRKEEA